MDKLTINFLIMIILNRVCVIGGAYLVFPLWVVGLIAMLVAVLSNDEWSDIYGKVLKK